MFVRRVLASAILTAAVVMSPAVARGDEASVAEELFQRGVTAMDRGDLISACALLSESQRLDPGGGTLLNLALCHERSGRLATAWARYHEALGAARRDGRADRISFAETHLAAVEPRLSHLAIAFTVRPANARATVDGVELPQAVWESGAPIDAGDHELRVEAPAHDAYKLSFSLAEGQTKRLAVPALTPTELSPHVDATSGTGTTRRILGWSFTGVGAGAVAASAILGGLAIGAESTADSSCPGAGECNDPRGLEASRRATSLSTAATISVIGGAVLLAGGIVLLLTTPSTKPASQRGTRTSVIGPLSDFEWKK
ncbi:hypothetical protein [Labilithrix luteola]|uniref:hypothetical protein n=1 Tax=Labilithrix luteola TaxID=1391654 RepID=UPI0011BA785C|nr:hypothetical protein [Labilithrix luteola]